MWRKKIYLDFPSGFHPILGKKNLVGQGGKVSIVFLFPSSFPSQPNDGNLKIFILIYLPKFSAFHISPQLNEEERSNARKEYVIH